MFYEKHYSGNEDGIQYRSTKDHSNADCLSRFPINLCSNVVEEELPDEIDFFYNSNLNLLPVTQESIANSTRKDSVLAGVLNSALTGDRYDTPNLVPYFFRKNKISVHQGCLVWGLRVIVPSELRGKILHELYEGHQGLVKMKALARSYVRWPKIDRDAEQLAGACFECLQKCPDPSPVLHSWDWPEQPWKRVHAEFAAQYLNHMFLVVSDAHSKWPEVVQIASTTSTATIRALGSIFSRYGFPEKLVSDNGPQLTSGKFEFFFNQMASDISLLSHSTLLVTELPNNLCKRQKKLFLQ